MAPANDMLRWIQNALELSFQLVVEKAICVIDDQRILTSSAQFE